MSRTTYQYEPKCVDEIIVREFAFDFPDDLNPIWAPQHMVRSQYLNGISLTMPYLEPFLVKTMREASAHITNAELLADIRQFNGQEACHYKCHRRLNELLKANGYPEFARVEAKLERSYARLARKSLRTRLAYSAGFECMTNGFTSWFINKRTHLFSGASPHVTSFWLMHMIEETEHKTVAFDVYRAYSGAFWPRFLGVFHGSFHVVGFGLLGMLVGLQKDGELKSPRRVLELVRELGSMAWNVGPFMLRALLPGHNPRRDTDPHWMQAWVNGHAALPAGSPIPLVDTNDPNMPVPDFTTAQRKTDG